MKCAILLICALLALSGCQGAADAPESAMNEWVRQARLDAEEAPKELYAAALLEDTLVVYTTSTRMMDTAKSFERQYPELTVRVEDLREEELFTMLERQFDSGDVACDVVCSADGRGVMINEFIPRGMVHKYVPYDIEDKILPGNNEELLMLAGEAMMIFYNDAYYDAPPVRNWWELTEEKWRGKVYMPNPARSMTTFSSLGVFMQYSDEMAAAYEELYGTAPKLKDGESAGELFVRKLIENDAVIVNASDEVTEIIGAPGTQNAHALGIMISSKIRVRDIGYNLRYIEDTMPFCGVYIPINIMVAGGAKNVNAAKLFIRWIFGEADGKGEGYKPYLQNGAWSVRGDVLDSTGVRADGLNLIHVDRTYIYKNKDKIAEFWLGLIENRQ